MVVIVCDEIYYCGCVDDELVVRVIIRRKTQLPFSSCTTHNVTHIYNMAGKEREMARWRN